MRQELLAMQQTGTYWVAGRLDDVTEDESGVFDWGHCQPGERTLTMAFYFPPIFSLFFVFLRLHLLRCENPRNNNYVFF